LAAKGAGLPGRGGAGNLFLMGLTLISLAVWRRSGAPGS
jgi:hypothetical protein